MAFLKPALSTSDVHRGLVSLPPVTERTATAFFNFALGLMPSSFEVRDMAVGDALVAHPGKTNTNETKQNIESKSLMLLNSNQLALAGHGGDKTTVMVGG